MQEIGNSLSNRNSLVKRKIPESFYAPPVLKTQVFSAEQRLHINHSHTNSLPVDTIQYPISNLHPSGSANNLTELHPASSFTMNQPVNQFAFSPSMLPVINNEIKSATSPFMNNQSQHAKTYSLPVSFDPQMDVNYTNQLQPPVRNKNLGDIPLPEGFTYETTPTGQIYYINHITKTTQWNDPRGFYNLPMNQNEINKDLRSSISNTIPLPTNWEEARTASGEVYYINHTDHTTTWSDPRLSIYMQQENLKNSNQNFIEQNKINNSTSNSSLFSPFSSASSSSSSSSSLNIMNQNGQHLSQFYDNFNQSGPANTNYTMISNLKKSLDQLLNKKYSICKELEDLSKKEMSLKSKLSPKDLDDVLGMLKINDVSINSFGKYDNMNIKSASQIQSNPAVNDINKTPQKINDKLNNSNLNNSNVETELDSTLVVAENTTLNLSSA